MRTNKERLIERYLNGRMSPSEQREFLKMAESDPGISRMLKADEVIARAVLRDRALLPIASAQPSAQLLSKLAASNPALQQGAQLAANSAASTASGGNGLIGSALFGSKLVQGFIAIVGTAGVVVGTFMVAPMIDSSGTEPTPAVRHERIEPMATPSIPMPVTPAEEMQGAAGEEIRESVQEKPAQLSTSSSRTETAVAEQEIRTSTASSIPSTPSAATEQAASQTKKSTARNQEEPQVFTSDSARVETIVR